MNELPPHGTRYRYVKYKCKCPDCRRANAEYKRNKVSRNKALAASETSAQGSACLAQSREGISCGKAISYEWHGCRGKDCETAARKRWRQHVFVRLVKVS